MPTEIREEANIPAAGVVNELSDEAIDKLSKKASKLVSGDKLINATWHCIMTNYRLHQLLRMAMSRRLETVDKRHHRELHEILVRSAQHHSSQSEFTRESVMREVTEMIVPWLMADLGDERSREEVIYQKQREEDREKRRQQPVPLPFRLCLGLPENEIGRERPVAIVGDLATVQYVLRELLAWYKPGDASGTTPRVMYLVNEMRQHNVVRMKGAIGSLVYEVGVNRWLASADTTSTLDKTLAPFVPFLADEQVDLLLVSDLSQMHRGLEGITNTPQRAAAQCLRTVRKWAELQGAALIFGVPTEHFDVNDRDWSRLQTYSNLVRVRSEVTPNGHIVIYGLRAGDFKTDEIAITTLKSEEVSHVE